MDVRTVGLSSLLLTLLFFSLGCGGSDNGNTGSGSTASECESQAECEGDNVCQDSQCVAPSDGADDDLEAETTLESGGTATQNGVHLMASEGAVENPIEVKVQNASDPTDETPLPSEAKGVGDFYRVSGQRNLEISADSDPLYIALPVPDGVDETNLAVAIRVSRKQVQGDNLPSGKNHFWTVVSAVYHPARDLLVLPINFVAKEGNAFAVVESSEYDSPEMTAENEDSETRDQGLIRTRKQYFLKKLFEEVKEFFEEGVKKKEDFFVKCRGGFDDGDCGSSEKSKVREYLNRVYEDLVSDFKNLGLKRTVPGRKVDGEQGRYYVYVIRKNGTANACGGGNGGMYNSLLNIGTTCYNGSGDPSEKTTRMEFFHAIQYNYPAISWSKLPKKRPLWVVEGTASFIENPDSDATTAIRDDGRNYRPVDEVLTLQDKSDNPAYTVQDFWVYFINERDSTPKDKLRPFFEKQSGMPNRVTVEKLAELYPEFQDLYWKWVRNQAVEAKNLDGDPIPEDADAGTPPRKPCLFNDDATIKSFEKKITYDAAGQNDLTETLVIDEAPKAEAVKITLKNTGMDAAAITAERTDPGSGRAKFYRKRSDSSVECWSNDSPGKIQKALAPGEEKVLYLLAANTEPVPKNQEANRVFLDFKISAETSNQGTEKPTVSMINPTEPASEPLRDTTLRLRADASDPDGGFIQSYEWSVTGGRGQTNNYSGNDKSISLWQNPGAFNPGVFKIKVTVTDDEGDQATAKREIRIIPEG